MAPEPTRDEPGVLWMLMASGLMGCPPGPPACRLSRDAQSRPAASVKADVPESQNFSAELESQ